MADQNSERWKAFMDQDFDPGHTPGATPATEQRIANALEYIAYQLGQINRKLDLVIGLNSRGVGEALGLQPSIASTALITRGGELRDNAFKPVLGAGFE